MNEPAAIDCQAIAWAVLRSAVLDVLDDREQALLWAFNWCDNRPGQAWRILDWLEEIRYEPDPPLQGQLWRLVANNQPAQLERCGSLLLPADLPQEEAERRLENLSTYLSSPQDWTEAHEFGMQCLLDEAERKDGGKQRLLDYLWPLSMDLALSQHRDESLLSWLVTHGMATRAVSGRRGRGMNGFHLLVLGAHHYDRQHLNASLEYDKVEKVCQILLSGGGQPKGPMVYFDNERQEGFSSPLALACRFYEEGDLDGLVIDGLLAAGADWLALPDGEIGHASMDRFAATPASGLMR